MRALACLPLLAGCTQLLGLDNLHQNAAGGDAPGVPTDDAPPGDAGPDVPLGAPITISGTATVTNSVTTGQVPLSDAALELALVSDATVLARTTTDDTGHFAMIVPSGSDVMLRTVTQAPFVVVLSATPPTADADFSFSVFGDQALVQLGSLCPTQLNVDPNLAQVFVLLADAANTPQAGYFVTSNHPGATCYPASSGSGSGNVTSSQGVAIVFNVAAGIEQIQAGDATGPVATPRAWPVSARSQSFVRIQVPTHNAP